MYTPDNEKNISKAHSRFKVARSIKEDGNQDKVIHYLGGVSEETDFESSFSKLNTTFVRYERTPCNLPKDYCHAWKFVLSPANSRHTFHMELNEKTPEQYGYFANADFFTESQKFMQLPQIIAKKNYFWLDFCGMPSDSLIGQVNDFIKSYNDFAEEIYLTFYMNPRGKEDVEQAVNQYGSSIEERAKSVCHTLKQKISIDIYSFSVLDVYVNGRSPMAVIKMKKKMKKTKTKTSKQTKNPICNSENYALMRDKGFSNLEIQTMWGVPTMAVAAYQAWNTMGGRTWNDQDIDLNTIRLGRQVCRNTIILDDEHDPENGMI